MGLWFIWVNVDGAKALEIVGKLDGKTKGGERGGGIGGVGFGWAGGFLGKMMLVGDGVEGFFVWLIIRDFMRNPNSSFVL